tara:strand:+ start:469 stop:894 length:426 start_codon:yes stop_codon:yes gene_type:complete
MSKENNKDDMDLSIAAELKKRGDMPMPMFRDFVGYVSDIDPHGDINLVRHDWNCLVCMDVSDEFIQLLNRLGEKGLLVSRRMDHMEAMFVHAYDSVEMYNLPVANKIPKNGYKKRRWAPVLVKAAETVPYPSPDPRGSHET